MHEELFAHAQCPEKYWALGLRLLPYSVGHDLLLYKEANALRVGVLKKPLDEKGRFELIRAVLICSKDWQGNQKPEKHLKLWGWLNQFRNFDMDMDRFHLYHCANVLNPPLVEVDGREGDRQLGAPFHSLLIQFLITYMGKTEVQALDYPLGLAKCHYYSHCEMKGNIKIMNEQEKAFEDYCKEMDAKAEKEKPTVGIPTK